MTTSLSSEALRNYNKYVKNRKLRKGGTKRKEKS